MNKLLRQVCDNEFPHLLLSKLCQKSLHFFSCLENPWTNVKYNRSISNTMLLLLKSPWFFIQGHRTLKQFGGTVVIQSLLKDVTGFASIPGKTWWGSVPTFLFLYWHCLFRILRITKYFVFNLGFYNLRKKHMYESKDFVLNVLTFDQAAWATLPANLCSWFLHVVVFKSERLREHLFEPCVICKVRD